MIIPTDVYDSATLAVPDPSYWDSTASHFYINAPGVSSDEGCHWGDDTKPIGNWAPYVAGANVDGSGNTFVKLGLNPVWQDSGLFSTKPTFGLKIECDGNCNGLPCEIDGGGVVSNNKATGAGGSDFCVVTVSKGGKANIVVYNLDGSDGGEADGADESTSSSESTPSSSSTPTPTPTPTTTSSSAPVTTSSSTSTSVSSTSSTPVSTSSTDAPTTSSSRTVSSYPVYSSSTSTSQFLGAVYHQNETTTASHSQSDSTAISTPPADSTTGGESESETKSSPAEPSQSENAGPRQDSAAVAGLIIAFVAAVYLL
ncbi:hypothetical protein F5Y14DRAFT_141039 [Nemania sp. NC0429]|nr:hypothetical protein F5Y14DRAFT_141039 [Nemania sp. NC0429]